MIELRSPQEIQQMEAAGEFVSSTLATLRNHAAVGVDLLELDALAHELIRDRGAESCYLDYAPSFGSGPFGFVLCTSVNDAALHGKPHSYRLQDGDLLSIDFAAKVDGWVADSAQSFVVGTARAEDLELIELTERALAAGIAAAVPGNKIGHISYAIGAVAKAAKIKVNLQFGGHGVGKTMHGEPFVPNDGRPGRGLPLQPGLVVAIEPWFMRGTDKLKVADDGWTLLSANGSRAAHSEHTVAITEDGPLVLTRPRG
ncbi:type I methionyl aminopeptidase [Arthrobacter sp. HY1533]|uniref:type I methionyl aminopeptidase n=1 Tax=Arthrobacter sp. HY1533 TaxID=2970919 RepID=UPI0022BA0FA2|nr:type I methionyl aminopeptidase [Arthrobacter sp. HY1533]